MAARGWHYADQEVRGNRWLLRFTRDRSPRSAGTGHDPRQRLRVELNAANVGVDGTYALDTASYGELDRSELLQLVRAAGWHEVRPGGDGVSYVAPLAAESVENPVSFLRGPSLAELRANPHVVRRASILESRYGFDPLSEDTANHARQRHNHYHRLIQRNALLALLYATVALIGLVVTFGVSVASTGSGWYMPLVVTLIMVGLFGMSLVKVRVLSRQRHREIGDFIETYRELQQLHQGDLPSSARA